MVPDSSSGEDDSNVGTRHAPKLARSSRGQGRGRRSRSHGGSRDRGGSRGLWRQQGMWRQQGGHGGTSMGATDTDDEWTWETSHTA